MMAIVYLFFGGGYVCFPGSWSMFFMPILVVTDPSDRISRFGFLLSGLKILRAFLHLSGLIWKDAPKLPSFWYILSLPPAWKSLELAEPHEMVSCLMVISITLALPQKLCYQVATGHHVSPNVSYQFQQYLKCQSWHGEAPRTETFWALAPLYWALFPCNFSTDTSLQQTNQSWMIVFGQNP